MTSNFRPPGLSSANRLASAPRDAIKGASAPVVVTPSQTLGSEKLTNGTMEAGSPPSSWTASGGSTLASVADERTGGAGTKSLGITRGSADLSVFQSNFSMIATDTFLVSVWVKNIDATSIAPFMLIGGTAAAIATSTSTSWVNIMGLYQMKGNTNIDARFNLAGSAGQIARGDDYSVKVITINPQVTAPSPNMRVSQLFTLPASPIIGSQIWLMPRISDYNSGNYWLVLLEYTGSQWNITLYSVATHIRTSRASATNIGSTDGVRVNMNGDSIYMETTANSGGVWTQRGSTISNSLYNTATGANAVITPDFTFGTLTAEGAT